MKLYKLWLEAKYEEAQVLQGMLAVGEGALIADGIPGIKVRYYVTSHQIKYNTKILG